METRANYAAVGAFVFAMVLLAFGAVVWLAGGQLNAPKAYYRIYFSGLVSGMREGAAVEYNGVPVGKVEEIRIDPDNVALVRTTIAIDPALTIKKDAVATLQSNLLSGVSFVQITGGTQDAPPLKAEGNERYPVIRSVPSTLASVAASGPELLNKLNATADRFNTILDEKNRQALSESLENLRVFTAGLAARSDDIAELTAQREFRHRRGLEALRQHRAQLRRAGRHRRPFDLGNLRFRQDGQKSWGYEQAAAGRDSGRSPRAAQLQPADPDQCRQPCRRGAAARRQRQPRGHECRTRSDEPACSATAARDTGRDEA